MALIHIRTTVTELLDEARKIRRYRGTPIERAKAEGRAIGARTLAARLGELGDAGKTHVSGEQYLAIVREEHDRASRDLADLRTSETPGPHAAEIAALNAQTDRINAATAAKGEMCDQLEKIVESLRTAIKSRENR
jgi:hypothetical protein